MADRSRARVGAGKCAAGERSKRMRAGHARWPPLPYAGIRQRGRRRRWRGGRIEAGDRGISRATRICRAARHLCRVAVCMPSQLFLPLAGTRVVRAGALPRHRLPLALQRAAGKRAKPCSCSAGRHRLRRARHARLTVIGTGGTDAGLKVAASTAPTWSSIIASRITPTRSCATGGAASTSSSRWRRINLIGPVAAHQSGRVSSSGIAAVWRSTRDGDDRDFRDPRHDLVQRLESDLAEITHPLSRVVEWDAQSRHRRKSHSATHPRPRRPHAPARGVKVVLLP